jgi:hypothetical protein
MKRDAIFVGAFFAAVVVIFAAIGLAFQNMPSHSPTGNNPQQKAVSLPQPTKQPEFSAAQIEEARLIITSHGYDCQVVDYMRTYIAGGGWIVVCNGYRYRFNIEDRGGRWWVEAIAQ